MKKLVLLTSVLALAACGGGSSGYTGDPTPDTPIVDTEIPNTGDNTGGENNNDNDTNTPGTGTENEGGNTGGTDTPVVDNYQFDMSGVRFIVAEPGESETFVFTTNDQGQIVNVTVNNTQSFDSNNPSDSEVAFVGYNVSWQHGDDKHHYTSPNPITTNEQLREFLVTCLTAEGDEEDNLALVQNLTLEDVDIETINYDIELLFQGKELGLKYSDIAGMVMTVSNDQESETEYAVLAGGDVNKLIPVEQIQTDSKITFNGEVLAVVNNETTSDDNAKLVLDPDAGTEILTMDLRDWYNVTITKNNDGVKFTFDNPENATFHTNLRPDATVQDETFDVQYYGENGTPTEATANFGYFEDYNDGNIEHELDFSGVFGGVK